MKQNLKHIWLAIILLISSLMMYGSQNLLAAELINRSLTMNSSLPGASDVAHRFNFEIPSTDDVGSIEFEYCSNDPFPGDPCTPPDGLDLSSATLASQSGETGFTIHPTSSTQNRIVLTRPPSAVTPGPVEYLFEDITNPSGTDNVFYVRLATFTSIDGTGSRIDEGGLAASTASAVNVTTEVPPYLEFCVGIVIFNNDCSTAAGGYIDFGELETDETATGISKMAVSTNAAFGYNITVDGTTLYSGKNPIPPMQPRQASQTSESQFGINLRANTNPEVGLDPTGPGSAQPAPDYNVPNEFIFKNGDTLVDSGSPSLKVTFTKSYIVNISNEQTPGTYTTTLTYVCTATF